MVKKLLCAILILVLSFSAFTHTASAQSKSGCIVTKVGSTTEPSPTLPPECLGVSGPCQAAPPIDSSASISDEIKEKWNIVLNNVPREQQMAIREIFYGVDCTGLLQDLSGTIINSTFEVNGISKAIGCPQDPVAILLSIYDYNSTKGLIIHELTHVWQVCTLRGETNVLLIPDAYTVEGGLTKYSRNECPQIQVGDNWRNEDHADTIALFLNPDVGELTCGNGAPNPFLSGSYPLHQNIAQLGVGKK